MANSGRLLGMLVTAAGPVAYGFYALTKDSATVVKAAAKPSKNVPVSFLDGTWYNELGSRMNITQSPDGHLVGNFCTGVESKKGAAGSQPRTLYGSASMDGNQNPTFGFSVVYKESTSSFSGQYFNHNGQEKLLTTWVLTSKIDDISDSWKNTRVGQNTFTRTRQDEM